MDAVLQQSPSATVAGKSTTATPGIPLACTRWGAGLPRMLLIHGFADGGFVWDAFISCLAGRYSGITLDLRGHGDSAWDPQGSYGSEIHAVDVLGMLDATSFGGVIIGHSLGAEVAIRVAARRPANVSALVLVDGGPLIESKAASVMQQNLGGLPWRYDSVDELQSVLIQRHPLADPHVLKQFARRALRPAADRRGFELKCDPALRRGLPAPDVDAIWNALESLTCPILLARGAMSAMLTQKKAAAILERVKGCRLTTVRAAGHAVPLENPRGLHEAVLPMISAFAG